MMFGNTMYPSAVEEQEQVAKKHKKHKRDEAAGDSSEKPSKRHKDEERTTDFSNGPYQDGDAPQGPGGPGVHGDDGRHHGGGRQLLRVPDVA